MKSDRKHLGDTFSELRSVTTEEIFILLKSMPGKYSPLDTIPTILLKKCADIFASVICHLANLSFREEDFLDRFKKAQVTPLIKKTGLDPEIPANYRPISNLVTISQDAWMIISDATQRSHLAMFKFHSISIGLQTVPQHWDCHAQNIEQCLHYGRRSTLYMPCGARPFCSVRHHATIINRLRHTFGIGHRLAHVIPYKQIAIREVWWRPVTTYNL